MGQLLSTTLAGANIVGFKATSPFALLDSAGNLGYRYSGSGGDGTYGAPHYLNGNVIINGNLTVTGTINGV